MRKLIGFTLLAVLLGTSGAHALSCHGNKEQVQRCLWDAQWYETVLYDCVRIADGGERCKVKRQRRAVPCPTCGG
jgi:hypothetical protein